MLISRDVLVLSSFGRSDLWSWRVVVWGRGGVRDFYEWEVEFFPSPCAHGAAGIKFHFIEKNKRPGRGKEPVGLGEG